MNSCSRFEFCAAPFCPLNDATLKDGIWFPDEEICKKKGAKANHLFIQQQRKIAVKTRELDSCYTFEMLNKMFKIKKGVMGIEPDKQREKQEQSWLEKRSEIRKLTDREKSNLRKRLEGGFSNRIFSILRSKKDLNQEVS